MIRRSNIQQLYNRFLFRKTRLLEGTDLPVKAGYRPVNFQISVEGYCNLKCTMCPRNDPKFKDAEMSYETCAAILDKMRFVKTVMLTGLGEPLLHKDLFRMIEHARKKKMDTIVTTNATLLNDKNIEKVLSSGLTIIDISIDSADPEVFKAIRVGTTLDKVAGNLRNLIERRNAAGSKLRVHVNSILMMRNYRKVKEMVKLCASAGVDEIHFSDMQYSFDVGISTRAESLRCASDAEKEEIRALFREGEALAEELNIVVHFPMLDQPKVREHCRQPWTMMVVDEKGLVRPCCAIHFVSFGDMTRQSFNEVWNNSNFMSFRERLLSDDVPSECKDCTFL
jgi:radical SAM protein with 4Fe4S-binding SPASM domain